MTAPTMNSPVLAEPGCPPGPVSQPASSDVGPPSRSGVATSPTNAAGQGLGPSASGIAGDGAAPAATPANTPDGFDASRSYFPVARRPRATRPPADALSMAETVAVMVGEVRP